VNWIQLAQDCLQLLALVFAVSNCWVLLPDNSLIKLYNPSNPSSTVIASNRKEQKCTYHRYNITVSRFTKKKKKKKKEKEKNSRKL
jgi:hypothetical protein